MFDGLNKVQQSDRSARAAPALVPAVTRALALLDRLAEERQPMPLARLASGLEIPKSSVHGLCTTLLALGYLRRHGDGSFSIGPRVMSLADAFIAGTGVTQEFAALWAEDGQVPDETVVLTILNGADVVYVATRSGARPLGLSFNIGMRLPAYLAASGKAMLAHLGEGALRSLLSGVELAPMAQRAGPSFEALIEELAEVRARGYSVDDEGVREGVYCIGAPVFDGRGDVVAGIGMCLQKSPRQLEGREAQRRHVVDVAARLTRRLGGRPT
ncbi:MAG TPA: IclR family transcriptional regulator [Burkholderiaceae bacterium]|nr:IclR family transcriptional regulator [Burkholderiaceae bacterium]